jgi:hypothetical protein
MEYRLRISHAVCSYAGCCTSIGLGDNYNYSQPPAGSIVIQMKHHARVYVYFIVFCSALHKLNNSLSGALLCCYMYGFGAAAKPPPLFWALGNFAAGRRGERKLIHLWVLNLVLERTEYSRNCVQNAGAVRPLT